MTIPSLKDWVTATYSSTDSRSQLLQNLDKAIGDYGAAPTPENRENVRLQLKYWKRDHAKNHKDWRRSVRNKKGAMTALDTELDPNVHNRLLDPKRMAALEFLAEHRKQALSKLFLGSRVAFKGSTLMAMRDSSRGALNRLKAAPEVAKAAAKPGVKLVHEVRGLVEVTTDPGAEAAAAADRTKMTDLIRQACDGANMQEVFDVLGLGNVGDFVMDLVPLLGILWSSAKAAKLWAEVITVSVRKADLLSRRHALASGSATAAFDALARIVEDEIASVSVKASIASTAAAAKVVAALADGGLASGPAIGTAQVLAGVLLTISEYRRDCKELEAANALLASNVIDLQLFVVCPLLGCYYLASQEVSTIIVQAQASYRSIHMVFDIEQLCRTIEPVLAQCRKYIELSRFEIPDMKGTRGLVDASWAFKHSFVHEYGARGRVIDRLVAVAFEGTTGVAMSIGKHIGEELDKCIDNRLAAGAGDIAYTPPDFSRI